jgi:hypothetical protein
MDRNILLDEYDKDVLRTYHQGLWRFLTRRCQRQFHPPDTDYWERGRRSIYRVPENIAIELRLLGLGRMHHDQEEV